MKIFTTILVFFFLGLISALPHLNYNSENNLTSITFKEQFSSSETNQILSRKKRAFPLIPLAAVALATVLFVPLVETTRYKPKLTYKPVTIEPPISEQQRIRESDLIWSLHSVKRLDQRNIADWMIRDTLRLGVLELIDQDCGRYRSTLNIYPTSPGVTNLFINEYRYGVELTVIHASNPNNPNQRTIVTAWHTALNRDGLPIRRQYYDSQPTCSRTI